MAKFLIVASFFVGYIALLFSFVLLVMWVGPIFGRKLEQRDRCWAEEDARARREREEFDRLLERVAQSDPLERNSK